jgi:hypothetical protein
MFLFDPTQHQPFRRKLATVRAEIASDRPLKGDARQDQVLIEVGNRIRRFSGMRDTDKSDRPLVVIVTKLDLWESLVPEYRTQSPMVASTRSGASALNLDRIDELSKGIRRLLAEHAPEVITAAESLAKQVTYIGVSALGVTPEHHPQHPDRWAVRPADVQPNGVEIPVLFGLQQQFPKLIPGGRRSGSARSA